MKYSDDKNNQVVDDIDFSTESVVEVVDESFDEVLTTDTATSEAVSMVEEDLGAVSLAHDEFEYEKRQTEQKIAPVVKEVTKQAVSEAVKYQQDKLKVEVNEVLQSEVGYRLNRYEKRRRRRDIKDKIGVVLKWVVVIGIIAFIYGTPQLRTKFSILFRDFGDLVEGLINNEEVSSNQLVEDALTNLGVDLNESFPSQDDDMENDESISERSEESHSIENKE